MDEQHSCRRVDVTFCVRSRQNGDHWNTGGRDKKKLAPVSGTSPVVGVLLMINHLAEALTVKQERALIEVNTNTANDWVIHSS